MEALLEMARNVSDQAEIYSLEQTIDSVSFEDAKLKALIAELERVDDLPSLVAVLEKIQVSAIATLTEEGKKRRRGKKSGAGE